MIIDKIYIINLERAKDRLKEVVSELKRLGGPFLNYSIFKAIDGKTIKDEEINKLLTLDAQYSFYINAFNYDQIRSRGEVGCYLSHLGVWKDMVKNNYNNVIILEDDVFTTLNKNQINKNLDLLPRDYDVAHLGWFSRFEGEYLKKSSNWVIPIENYKHFSMIYGTFAYMLSNKGAKELIANAIPINMQVDSFISVYSSLKPSFKRYLSIEQLFEQGQGMKGTHSDCSKCYEGDQIRTKYEKHEPFGMNYLNKSNNFMIIITIGVIIIIIIHIQNKKK
jgi:GR25 family glycosyltransferase involved in LPS biosynthesis